MAETSRRSTRKAPAKKTAKRTSSSSGSGSEQAPPRKAGARAQARPRPQPVQVARKVAEQLTELTGKQPESVTAIEKSDDGWQIQFEVVESRRIPDSADMLALYQVEADSSGELAGYRRLRRYARGHSGDDPGGGR